MDTILTTIGGIFWVITYIEIIRCGLRDKTCSMPLSAIGLNFSWELIFLLNNGWDSSRLLVIINLIWIILDVVIGYLHFKYNKKDFPEKGCGFAKGRNLLYVMHKFSWGLGRVFSPPVRGAFFVLEVPDEFCTA